MSKKILVVDDEKRIVDILTLNLKKESYTVLCAYDGIDAVKIAFEENPDLILLDIMMPRQDGFETCKKIRQKLNTPIIMLTARSEEVDIVLGLELGADDYITKPFRMREVLARVKANMRRTTESLENTPSRKTTTVGELVIDEDRYEVEKRGEKIVLTHREFELLKFLAKQKTQVFTREALLEKVWDFEYFGDARTVDVTVRRLREKVEDDPAKPVYILTKRGVGYYFADL